MESLIAYDADGNVVATLDYMVSTDEDGKVVGLIDFASHEASGGQHTDYWLAGDAKGSKVWPEWLGSQAHAFRVELDGPPGNKRLVALVHKESGHRRERAAVEAAIEAVPVNEDGAKDIRHIVGGPTKPIRLDPDGKTADRVRPKPLPVPTISRL